MIVHIFTEVNSQPAAGNTESQFFAIPQKHDPDMLGCYLFLQFSQLPDIVRTETAELDRYLASMNLLSDGERLERHRLVPAEILEQAVTLARSHLARDSPIKIATALRITIKVVDCGSGRLMGAWA